MFKKIQAVLSFSSAQRAPQQGKPLNFGIAHNQSSALVNQQDEILFSARTLCCVLNGHNRDTSHKDGD